MSHKESKHDKASAKVLKKAKSFKDDIKSKIIRRTPSTSSPSKTLPSRGHKGHKDNSPPVKKKGLRRGSSFNDGSKKEKLAQGENNVEKLQMESKKVLQAVGYIQDVVDKSILQMLPGSATIVLETVMELTQLLGKYFIKQDSSMLVSSYSQVYQSLSNLIRWSDKVMMYSATEKVNKEDASAVIQGLRSAVTELVSLSIEKLQSMPSVGKNDASSPSKCLLTVPPGSDVCKRSSLPDIPLTPREQKILTETSFSFDDTDDAKSAPPPKPPLPQSFQLDHKRPNASNPGDDVFTTTTNNDATPPPLPEKKRSSSAGSTYDNTNPQMMSTTGEMLDLGPSGNSTPVNYSPHHSLHLPEGLSCGMSPHTQSPVGSNSSVDDMLSDSSTLTDSLTASYQAYSARLSHYDNFGTTQSQEIKHLTAQIKELTSSVHEEKVVCTLDNGGKPPQLPLKKGNTAMTLSPLSQIRDIRKERSPVQSQYDNVLALMRNDALDVPFKTTVHESGIRESQSAMTFSSASASSYRSTTMSNQLFSKSQHVTLAKESYSSSEVCSFSSLSNSEMSSTQDPPPLPLKKRHVEAYMQMFGDYSGPSLADITRNSMQSINFYQSQFFNHQMEFFTPFNPTRSNTMSMMSDVSSRSSDVFSMTSASSSEDSSGVTGRSSLTGSSVTGTSSAENAQLTPIAPGSPYKQICDKSPGRSDLQTKDRHGDGPPPDINLKEQKQKRRSRKPSEKGKDPDQDSGLQVDMIHPTLNAVDVTDQLVKNPDNEGTEVRGGPVDALIVHATMAGKKNHFMYQEAFLTTYRTFITPAALLHKLLYRYRKFSNMSDTKKKKLSRNAFSLLIRVVDELCMDIGEDVLQMLLDLVLELVSDGELMLSRILRKKVLEKVEYKKQLGVHQVTLLSSYQLTSKQYALTDFKSLQLAEQMTYLDASLFIKIEIPEVLLWAKDQNEEHSPNLTEFTEHFNKMSFWCRTQVLQQEEPKERERILMKFIKIMKHLRRLNNFNSYLAILSALDSAPIRRLEWQKQNLEALKEFCQLIDSSSSFRAYRRALAETEPPCIPYIGLILQDLTFVHIGNPDFLQEDIVNFAKRWQQFNILDNMKRFKKCDYDFKKNTKIITYFNNFDDCLSEESLWQISENIKPRTTRKKPLPPQN